jgi:hypothetical protein
MVGAVLAAAAVKRTWSDDMQIGKLAGPMP